MLFLSCCDGVADVAREDRGFSRRGTSCVTDVHLSTLMLLSLILSGSSRGQTSRSQAKPTPAAGGSESSRVTTGSEVSLNNVSRNDSGLRASATATPFNVSTANSSTVAATKATAPVSTVTQSATGLFPNQTCSRVRAQAAADCWMIQSGTKASLTITQPCVSRGCQSRRFCSFWAS
ncbi:FXYD domain containing ion transport regulator 5 isoform X6 [Synchiropus splendidus]|uniref:FXYD domain containing ion transport regulator 5 isoform X6 n=1 Tax=Synchiropus splendidus TaxID=270530 RepID=UPI00237DC22B|nr:FXYD domain containing ion transport regulator 5 isoform X6 [Synchiropus splendidus]